MVKSLNPLAPKLKSHRPAVVFQYLQKALGPQVQLNSVTSRELTTLAVAADKILCGDLEPALDVLLQRFKSVESVATGTLEAPVAMNLEVIPETTVSSLSLSERTEAGALIKRRCKMQTSGADRLPSPVRGQSPGSY